MPNEQIFMSAMNKATVGKDLEKKWSNDEVPLNRRADSRMDKFQAQYSEYSDNEPIKIKAKELLDKYGNSKNVPAEELDFDKSGYDDARLLAFIKLTEEKQNKVEKA